MGMDLRMFLQSYVSVLFVVDVTGCLDQTVAVHY
jgi:hypothetical protein